MKLKKMFVKLFDLKPREGAVLSDTKFAFMVQSINIFWVDSTN